MEHEGIILRPAVGPVGRRLAGGQEGEASKFRQASRRRNHLSGPTTTVRDFSRKTVQLPVTTNRLALGGIFRRGSRPFQCWRRGRRSSWRDDDILIVCQGNGKQKCKLHLTPSAT